MEYLYRFLIAQREIGPKGRAISLEEIQAGDVIQLSFLSGQFSHSLFVVDAGEIPDEQHILVATHSENCDNRPLSSYHFQEYRCLEIFYENCSLPYPDS